VASGDIYLFCSDGLCGCVPDAEIQSRIRDHESDLRAAAVALIEAANAAGGVDNSTVALVRIDDAELPGAEAPNAVTLPEESDDELARLDGILERRYQEKSVAPEETTDGETDHGVDLDAKPPRLHRRWQWLVPALLLALLAGLLVWPRLKRLEPSPESPPGLSPDGETSPQPSEGAPSTGLALLFVAAGTAERGAAVYLDGIHQGTLREIEPGLLVESGSHLLTVVNMGGDTLMTRRIELKANDTLDLVVR
jgi:hypothetical protein